MDGLLVFLIVLLGVCCSHGWLSGSELEVTVRPGDNITLYCDYKTPSGVFIVWIRNCSHLNQPSLILRTQYQYNPSYLDEAVDPLNPFPRFHLVNNKSSDSYDLLITNITDSDEGLYYCGTEQKVNTHISEEYVYRYANVTARILLNSSAPHCDIHETREECGVCWKLLCSLCPASAVLCSLFSSLLVYKFCQKTAKKPEDDEKRCDSRSQTTQGEDDVCYAALEIRQPSQRPRKKKTQSSDFSTYSAINTSRL